jgi:flagellar capping protein FliD
MKQKIWENQEIVEHHKAETDREITSVKVTVDSIQKGLEDSMSDVSRRLREQQSKMEQKAVVDKAELQVEIQSLQQEVNQIKIKTGEQTQVQVHRSGTVVEASAQSSDRNVNLTSTDPRAGSSNAESLRIPGN